MWTGLLMKANNALPYVPEMKQCDVVEKGDGWLVRDIMLKDVPLREKVTFEPEKRVHLSSARAAPSSGRSKTSSVRTTREISR